MSRASQVDSHFDILKFFPDMTDIIACKKALKWIDVPTSRLKIFLERKARAVDFFCVFCAHYRNQKCEAKEYEKLYRVDSQLHDCDVKFH